MCILPSNFQSFSLRYTIKKIKCMRHGFNIYKIQTKYEFDIELEFIIEYDPIFLIFK